MCVTCLYMRISMIFFIHIYIYDYYNNIKRLVCPHILYMIVLQKVSRAERTAYTTMMMAHYHHR